jgi:hypothetical protein
LAIRKPHLQPSRGPIAERLKSVPKIEENPLLVISFKLLDLHGNAKFSTIHCEGGYLEKLLERLIALNQSPLNLFKTGRNALRSHLIDFSETTEPNGFTSLNAQLRDSEAWQCQISSNEHGRLHGILIEEIFYIVWVDPCHLLYSKKEDWCKSHRRP